MNSTNFDPTAGERARAIREGRAGQRMTTDPTAGERARAVQERRVHLQITDPTDPDYGLPLDPDRKLGPERKLDQKRELDPHPEPPTA